MKDKNPVLYGKFIFSIVTAITIGVILALLGIGTYQVITKSYPASEVVGNGDDNSLLNKENINDITNDKITSKIKNKTDEKIEKFKNIGEEEDPDPTFISRFSRAFVYSAPSTTPSLSTLLDVAVKPEKITALAYSVRDIDRNTILSEKNPEKLLPIASVTKLVTAVVAKINIDADKQITISPRVMSTEGDSGKLRLGETYKAKELFYPLLMVSSNDSAEALAASYGRKEFIKKMNDWASSIGAYRTYFRDPSGLSPENVSTASDISLIAQWIKEHEPDIFDITLMKSKVVRSHTWINPTHFLNISSYEGGKNGYTPEANRTSVSLFSLGYPKKTYSVVLLGSGQRDKDTLSVLYEALR